MELATKTAAGIDIDPVDELKSGIKDEFIGILPGGQLYLAANRLGGALGYGSIAIENTFASKGGRGAVTPQPIRIPPRNDMQAYNLYPPSKDASKSPMAVKIPEVEKHAEAINREQERQPAPPTTSFTGKKWGDLRDVFDELGLSRSDIQRVVARAKNKPDDEKDGKYNKTVTVKIDGEKYDLKLKFRDWKLQSWTLKPQTKKKK